MSKHTPGPWRVMRRSNQTGTLRRLVVGRANQPIVEPASDDDACLIAAAPELLEALRNVTDMLLEWHADFPKYIGDNEEKAIGAARFAICKAEGKQQ